MSTNSHSQIAKGTVCFIDKGYHEKSDSWFHFHLCLTKLVDIEVKIIMFVIQVQEEVAWQSQDWPKACDIQVQ